MEKYLSIWKAILSFVNDALHGGGIGSWEKTVRTAGLKVGLFAVAGVISIGCWLYTFGSFILFGHPGAVRWTAMVTVSAIATEATVWVGAFTLGWSAFSNRRRLWLKLKTWITGKRSRIAEEEVS